MYVSFFGLIVWFIFVMFPQMIIIMTLEPNLHWVRLEGG